MGRDASSITTLKKFYKNLPEDVFDYHVFKKEIDGGNDRAAIITLATLLDDTLKEALIGKMRKVSNDDYEKVFKADGPLGAFSAKIDTAYLFGIIEEIDRDRLHDIREMRNACAHCKIPISFENQELANVAKRLFSANGGMWPPQNTTNPDDIRAGFIGECLLLELIIVKGREEALNHFWGKVVRDDPPQP